MSRRQDILEASQHLFGRHGLRRVTTDDIAREAHVSKATIYKLYRNKQEILEAVVRKEMDELLSRIEAAVAAEDTVEGRLRAHLLTKIGTVHELINLHSVTSESLAEHWEHAAGLRERFVAEETRIIRDILAAGVESGGLVVGDVAVTAHLLAAALRSLESPWDVDGLDLSVEDQADAMLKILLDGLRRRE